MKRTSRILLFILTLALVLPSFGIETVATEPSNASEHKTISFIVVFKSENLPENVTELVTEAGGQITYKVPEIGVIEVTTEKPSHFLKEMQSYREVLSIGPSLAVKLDLPENDIDQMDLEQTDLQPVPADQNIWEAGWQWDIERVTNQFASHNVHTGTHDVVVAVIDTGFDFDHPDLRANIVPGSKTFVPGTTDAWDANGHGTHVAGTIAANGRLKGIAPDVGLRAYRVLDEAGGGDFIWITDAIVAAANDGVDVINMSLGGMVVNGQWFFTDPDTGERIRMRNNAADKVALNRAIRYAVKRDVTVVAAAGNDALDLSNPAKVKDWFNELINELLDEIGLSLVLDIKGAMFAVPAQIPGVITVSATGGGFGSEDRLTFYSNYGNGAINLGAPGGDQGPDFPDEIEPDFYKYLVISTFPTYLPQSEVAEHFFGEAGYEWGAGTSMASPQVAGAAAAYISQVYQETGKKPKPSQVQARLQQTADNAGKRGYDEQYGHGIINVYQALKR